MRQAFVKLEMPDLSRLIEALAMLGLGEKELGPWFFNYWALAVTEKLATFSASRFAGAVSAAGALGLSEESLGPRFMRLLLVRCRALLQVFTHEELDAVLVGLSKLKGFNRHAPVVQEMLARREFFKQQRPQHQPQQQQPRHLVLPRYQRFLLFTLSTRAQRRAAEQPTDETPPAHLLDANAIRYGLWTAALQKKVVEMHQVAEHERRAAAFEALGFSEQFRWKFEEEEQPTLLIPNDPFEGELGTWAFGMASLIFYLSESSLRLGAAQ